MTLSPILIIPDTHRPYHDKRAWELVMRVGKDLKPEIIIVMGDFADCYSISSYSHDPSRATNLQNEVFDVRAGLRELSGLKAKRKIFIEGNHEDRLRRYLQDKAPQLFGMVSTESLLELPKDKWEFVPYKSDIRIGKVYFTHDVGNTGKYSTQRALDVYQHSVVIGHSHRMGYIVDGNAKGEMKVGAQFGWLGDRSAVDYTHKVAVNTNWPLGFGIGYLDKSTEMVYLTPVPIVNYTCVVNGKLYG